MKQIRLIGDSHGENQYYLKIAKKSEYSVQLGDLAFDYEFMKQLDADKHKVILGNHDNYDRRDFPHNLGDYGTYTLNGIPFFFIRGGFSIDFAYRLRREQSTGIKSFWVEEELSLPRMAECLEFYKSVKPEFLISHEPPASIAKRIGNDFILKEYGFNPKTFTTNTQELLQACISSYEPKLHVFGHFHANHDIIQGRTRFICLNMIPRHRYFIDINENLEIL